MILRQIGSAPFTIYTNRHLDVWLVGAGYQFLDEFHSSEFSESWSVTDSTKEVKTFKKLTPKYLAALRELYTGPLAESSQVPHFKKIIKEHWHDGTK